MILETFDGGPEEFARALGWHIEPQGACKGDRCVPMTNITSARDFAAALGIPLVRDEAHGLVAAGPESGGRALATAVAPEFTLPDRTGAPFSLSSLRGQKVFLLAWASW